jgi:para-nitrobenzyl esterase
MWNIPANVTSLPADMAPEAKPAGSVYGPNYSGPSSPYLGPRTPAGPKHNYHIQVFALDTTVPAEPAITALPALITALTGHVLASGEVVGLGSVDPNAPPAPARGGGGGRGGPPGGGAPAAGAPVGGGAGRGPGQ